MTSISQPVNPPQAQSATQAAASSHSPVASTGGKATQAAGSASSKSSYASATKTSFNTPSGPSNNAQTGPAYNHGKSDANISLNNRPPVAVPAVGPMVNGNTATTSGTGDHGRKSSVTINPAGAPGYMPNGASSTGKSSASNNIQFGAMDSSSTATKNASSQPMTSGDSLTVHHSSTNPRTASPQKSPSPIPQPPASGGKPPSALHGQSSSVNFGNFGGSEGNLRASSISQGPLMSGPQTSHLRRESSQSQHSDMSGHGMGPVPSRGGYPPQGGRGRGYSTYGQQAPYSPAQSYRSTPNQPRSGSVTSFQQQNRPYQPYPNSPHQAPRQPHSPMPPNAQPIPGQGGQMPMQAPHMGQPQYGGYPSQPYGYNPNMAPQQGFPVPYMNPVNPDFMAQWQHMYGQTPPNMVAPQSPRPPTQYPPGPQTPFQGQYAPQQPPTMSRTSSTLSGADRPASSMGKSQASMTPAPHAVTPSQQSNSPAPKNNSFQRPKRSAGIIIKDPNSGEVVNLKQSASPAPSNKSSTSISAAPTPPPAPSISASNSDASHSRTESKSVSKTEGKDLREQLARQHREKEETEAKVAQAKKDEEARMQKEKADADAKQMAAAKAQMDAEDAEKQNKIEAVKAKEAAEAAEAAAKATTLPSDDAPGITDEDIARWEAEEQEQQRKELEAEAAYNKKKQAEKDEAARKEAEAFKMADEEMKKAEREAEEAEEARIREKEKGFEQAEKPASDAGTPTRIPSTPEIETPGDSGAATPSSDIQAMPPPDRAAAKQKPTALKLETTRSVEPPQPSAALMSLRSARKLISLDIGYPPDMASPNPAINKAAKDGKFRYDRDFLLQFKTAFTDKPSENWSEKIKETVGDTGEPQSARGTPRGGGGSLLGGRQPSNRPPVPPMQQQMGNFGQSRTLPAGTTSQQRFEAASRGGGMQRPPQPMQNPFAGTFGRGAGSFPQAAGAIRMDRTPSSTSLAHPNSPRTTSQRGGSQRGSRAGRREDPKDNKNMPLTAGANLKPIEVTSGGWKPRSVGPNAMASGPAPGGDMLLAPDVVQRKVKSNLNKMTPNNFDKISDQILAMAHQSKDEDDGRSLRQVIQLTFEKATDEEHWAEMYAQFCKRMLDSMSSEIKDKSITDKKGDVVVGGSLFRKYLLTRCQTEFERGWKVHLPEKPEGASQEATMLSDEYYQAAAAKRRGLGLVRFIGELYKLGMLTERIMHECVKKLVDYDGTPDEAEIESLTSLLRTIGQQLDASEKGHTMMDAYFSRINNMITIKDLPSRLQFMLMDVVDLRLRHNWRPHGAGAVKGPTTIEAVRTQAQEQDRQKEAQRLAESSRRGGGGGRPPLGRGDARAGSQFGPPQPDYQRNTIGVEDLRRLGSRGISRQASTTPTSFGPTSMFASARGSNTRRPLPTANANDSGASSRVSTPPAQKDKKEKEENAKSGANTFSLLATEDVPGDATSPGPSPAPAKAQLATLDTAKGKSTDGGSSTQKS
ncbi:uncharacterized protein KY384_005508 [Bacidia gigantensis]|uniref:uncharacterized protein n=1 Tax=Bacidia gigantensis TaxID=2732470 RepID=UPI001D0557BA|nr:uncharacterized protein KY384_005508 [Bacidia gigantensis]KAG8530026.1 hypothetical protein KY384_005508 [Bacidia gigantensis]